jgi:hypothetical protein
VQVQADQAAIPARPDRAGAKLPLSLVVNVCDVAQLEEGPAVALIGQPQLDPAHVVGHLPGRIEPVRRVTAGDGAARVALKLVPAASFSSPLTGRNQRGMRSGLVQASQTSVSSAG